MASSFFFLQAEPSEQKLPLLKKFEEFADDNKKQVYIIDKPLGGNKYNYEFDGSLLILIPNYKLIFINFTDSYSKFDDYVDDFIEDLGFISDKYDYKKIIGRPKNWRDELVVRENYDDSLLDIQRFLSQHFLDSSLLKKKCELLISLLTGSVNDINLVKGDVPDNILDKVKQKIILFDGDQTRFVYQVFDKKRITIQGLSGTGKTELLLHKLKEIYSDNSKSKIVFTCHNKILADSLRGRIPDFFNFMKVEEQIKWNEKLWCVNAWGSQSDKNTGTYSYICSFYNLEFRRYSYGISFDYVCKMALKELDNNKSVEEIGFAFDYILIDESQDFPNSFFDLCEKVTRNTVYIAGDIFQSIFVDNVIGEVQPDFLLSKCYRTDPKTLMFAHSIGMGLFENPKLRWLEDKEWEACGYLVEKTEGDNRYILKREPLRRFEDLQVSNVQSIELTTANYQDNEIAESKIKDILHKIIQDNPTVLPDDIGIIFIDNIKNTYETADKLEFSIQREFGWRVNKAYESKERIPDTLFISNKNNVKGLEFPFVICVTKKINNSQSYRNALYMMITRSFIKTYLLLSHDSNIDLIPTITNGLDSILEKGYIDISAPTAWEKANMRATISYKKEHKSLYDVVHQIFDELNVQKKNRAELYNITKQLVGKEFDYESVYEIIEFNNSKIEEKV